MIENKLLTQLINVLPNRMPIPKEIELLYQWIEDNKFYIDLPDGYRIGFLYPLEDLKQNWKENERAGGTIIDFSARDQKNLKFWFGGELNAEVAERLCVFAQSGAEGSVCAFWLTEFDEVKIVHMGSGPGSNLCSILADTGVDFLRLLAIGYDEICWDEDFPFPPNYNREELLVKPNLKFQGWVKETFNVEIPKTALEIVMHPATMLDESSPDDFFNWCQRNKTSTAGNST